jgi:Chemotaxis response regulator containing a CheY-like receiver domain and a methylesterase domain
MGKNKIRVLVVDDSLVFREAIIRGIDADIMIEVIARASDPFEARDKILEYEPDVMTCDVEMPKMNGIEFIRRLLPQYAIPVIVVSSLSDAVFDAMNAGAVDFVAKPNNKNPGDMQAFIQELVAKIKIAASSHVTQQTIANTKSIIQPSGFAPNKIIAIGSSTGGTEALANLLMQLPANIPGILIVQHIPPVFSRMFAERLDNQTLLHVKEAQNGDYLETGKVLIAPGDQHMRIKKIGDKYKVEVFTGDKVNGHCPSVDILFDSVAKEAGNHAVGIILTGMGYDGAKGLLSMKRKGARTIGQDEKSCVVYGMPKVAYDIGAVEKQASLGNIPSVLYQMLR